MTVDLDGVGVVHAVADPAGAAAVGRDVRLRLDLSRTARLRPPATGAQLP
jgi:Ser-tRNA(Ala) deacylase AlaX